MKTLHLVSLLFLSWGTLCHGQIKSHDFSAYGIRWGATNNGLCAGIGISWVDVKDNYKDCIAILYVSMTNTNQMRIGLPIRTQRFTAKLEGRGNKEVSKTSLGKSFGQPLDKVKTWKDLPQRNGWALLTADMVAPLQIGSFRVKETFRVSTTSDYILSGVITVFQMNEKQELAPVRLPYNVKFLLEADE
jgi:hypothetical protein